MISFALQKGSTVFEQIVVMILLIAVVCLMIGLSFCCVKGGPYLSGTFAKNSLINSFWHYRRLDDKYFAQIQEEMEQMKEV